MKRLRPCRQVILYIISSNGQVISVLFTQDKVWYVIGFRGDKELRRGAQH